MEPKQPKAKTEKEKQDELADILKKNEFFINEQKKGEEEIEKLKKENDIKKEEIKTKNNEELFNLIIDELKDYLKSQDATNEIAQEKQKLESDINNAYYKAKQAIEHSKEIDLANKDIISKIKEINEETKEIEKKIKQNYDETKAQCDKFKEEYKKKIRRNIKRSFNERK